ncbi:MAG: DUF1294 domain-containing protein [Candidatus Methanomethylophilaceae archaeon]|jgi:uncharacterized membrane protein YsdA (DUF1294 family)|nr:DUF1294 domain-containing protein [Candidatus Methanomethylophilaceae archaeon]
MSILVIALAIYAVLNLLAMAAYFSDKKKAQKDEWRTPESTLLLWALVGPFGALAGMNMARHKTRKAKFKLVYVFLGIHLVILAYLLFTNIF